MGDGFFVGYSDGSENKASSAKPDERHTDHVNLSYGDALGTRPAGQSCAKGTLFSMVSTRKRRSLILVAFRRDLSLVSE
jgi:hypothetical protein